MCFFSSYPWVILMLPVCHEDTRPALSGRWSWKLWEGISHVLQGMWSLLLGLKSQWRYMIFLLFLVVCFLWSAITVSHMDSLGLFWYLSIQKRCFLLKCMFGGYEYQVIFSWPIPKTIHFLSFQSATKTESVHFPNKFKEYRSQGSGVEVTEKGRMWWYWS